MLLLCALLWGGADAFALRCAIPDLGLETRCTQVLDNGVFRARYLNPNTGRFWTMDGFEGASEDPLSLHKYAYCSGNPLNNTDPCGYSDGTLGGLTVAGGGISFLAGLQLPALSGAMIKGTIVALVGAATVAVTVTGDEEDDKDKPPNTMAVQLQEGSSLEGGKHYWSMALVELKRNIGVTKLQVQTALGVMWAFYKDPAGKVMDEKWDKFSFSRHRYALSAAIVKMSAWVKATAPVSFIGTVHTEYLYPTDEDAPRIDLANYRGTNLRQ